LALHVCAREDGIRRSKDLRARVRKFLNLTNERKQMSTKTLRKRVSLAAVSAVGAALLTLVPISSANATGILVVGSNGNVAFPATTVCASTTSMSRGLVTQTGTGTTITATMLQTGSLAVFVPATSSVLNDLVVSGGTIVRATGDTTDPALNGSLTKATAASGKNICAEVVPNVGATTMYLYSYSGPSSASSPVGVATISVASAGTAGATSASKSTIAIQDNASTNVTHPTNGLDSLTGGSIVYGSTGSLYVRARDAYDVGINSTSGAIVTATNGALVKWTSLFPTQPTDVTSKDWTSANHYIGVKCGATTKTTTVSVTVDSVLIGSKTFKCLGDIASITATAGGVQSTTTAGATTWASDATLGSYLTYLVKDADGNLIPEPTTVAYRDGANAFVAGATISQQQTAARVALGKGGYGYWTCTGLEGSAPIQLSALNTLGVRILSNVVTAKCAEDAATYTISSNKASYETGDVAEFTVTLSTKNKTVVNDMQNMAQSYTASDVTACTPGSTTTPTLSSGAFASLVTTPSCADQASDGKIVYKALIGQDAGKFTVAFSIPALNGNTYGATAQTASITVVKAGGAEVSNAEVLKSIVALIASINKQIQALQKLILKR